MIETQKLNKLSQIIDTIAPSDTCLRETGCKFAELCADQEAEAEQMLLKLKAGELDTLLPINGKSEVREKLSSILCEEW